MLIRSQYRRSPVCSQVINLRTAFMVYRNARWGFGQSRGDCVLQPGPASYPGKSGPALANPDGVAARSERGGHNPFGVGCWWRGLPRVARASQPGALGQNPVGIRQDERGEESCHARLGRPFRSFTEGHSVVAGIAAGRVRARLKSLAPAQIVGRRRKGQRRSQDTNLMQASTAARQDRPPGRGGAGKPGAAGTHGSLRRAL